MNIIINAAQAAKATQKPLEDRRVEVVTSYIEEIGAGFIEVRIKDNGIGMDETTRGQIFDPFFTTKSVGEGTGLGMSIVMGIMRDHNAEIVVESELGQGTEFLLRFPV
jgi:signal transduction histidine kinase